jgi:hypothetical protein
VRQHALTSNDPRRAASEQEQQLEGHDGHEADCQGATKIPGDRPEARVRQHRTANNVGQHHKNNDHDSGDGKQALGSGTTGGRPDFVHLVGRHSGAP